MCIWGRMLFLLLAGLVRLWVLGTGWGRCQEVLWGMQVQVQLLLLLMLCLWVLETKRGRWSGEMQS